MSGGGAAYWGPDTPEARREVERVRAGELPERYAEPWGRPFFEAAAPSLVPGVRILDIGSGKRPTLPPEERPSDGRYTGMDISAKELDAAPGGAYDETIVGDISSRRPELENRFELILSWQVLEHVPSMADALENMRAYLEPGGRMVSQVSGSLAVYSLLARIMPHAVSSRLMARLLGADPGDKFPTRYDRCRASKLEPLLERWSEHGLTPLYKAGAYFRFSRPLERIYIRYEDWTERREHRDLATHYVIWAVK